MENTTQALLCCLGDQVAGKPTQFLFERAAAAENLDWRAITVEIATDDLGVAVEGLRVMGFQACRFFFSLEQPASLLLSEGDPWSVFVGRVTSAVLHEHKWQTWHHLGPACLRWASAEIDLRQTMCWLSGDSIRCRSFIAALSPEACPKTIVWSDPPDQLPDLLRHAGCDEAIMGLIRCVDSGASENAPLASEDLDSNSGGCVVVVGDSFPEIDGEAALFQASLSPQVTRWLVISGDSAAKRLRQQLAATNPAIQAQLFGEADQLVACEAYDFERWTGRQIDMHFLRDALDEYSDF